MKLTINKKIMIGFGLIIVLMIIANVYVLYQLLVISDTAKVTLTSEVRAIDIVKRLQTLLYGEERNAQKYWISNDKAYYDLFAEGSRSFNGSVDSLLGMQSKDDRYQLINKIQRIHNWFVSQVAFSNHPDQKVKKESVLQKRSDSLEVLHTTLIDLIKLNQVSIDNAMTNVETITSRSSGVSIFFASCTLIGAIILAFFIPRMITKPIKILIRGTEQIARGTFEPINVTSRDEIAQLTAAVNDMSNKLKKYDEYKSQLMHHIAHELRTPFQIILSILYKLNRQEIGKLTNEQVEMLQSIRKNVNAANNYTNQLLDIAKIEAGMMEYNLKPFDLLSAIQPTVDDARIMAAQKDIHLTLEAEQLPIISADEEKIYAIVNNLLGNAIKYTERGGLIKLSFSIDGNRVIISVEDTGIGIAPEDLQKIFNKFYQSKNATQASAKGTGIGLALVKAYTEGHNGKVSVKSILGEGTTFHIELPIIFDNVNTRI